MASLALTQITACTHGDEDYARDLKLTGHTKATLYFLTSKYDLSATEAATVFGDIFLDETALPCVQPVCPTYARLLRNKVKGVSEVSRNKNEDRVKRHHEVHAADIKKSDTASSDLFWNTIQNQISWAAGRVGVNLNGAGSQPTQLMARLAAARTSLPGKQSSAAYPPNTADEIVGALLWRSTHGNYATPQSQAGTKRKIQPEPTENRKKMKSASISAAAAETQPSPESGGDTWPARAAAGPLPVRPSSGPDYTAIPKMSWPTGASQFYRQSAVAMGVKLVLKDDTRLHEMIRRFGRLPAHITSHLAANVRNQITLPPGSAQPSRSTSSTNNGSSFNAAPLSALPAASAHASSSVAAQLAQQTSAALANSDTQRQDMNNIRRSARRPKPNAMRQSYTSSAADIAMLDVDESSDSLSEAIVSPSSRRRTQRKVAPPSTHNDPPTLRFPSSREEQERREAEGRAGRNRKPSPSSTSLEMDIAQDFAPTTDPDDDEVLELWVDLKQGAWFMYDGNRLSQYITKLQRSQDGASFMIHFQDGSSGQLPLTGLKFGDLRKVQPGKCGAAIAQDVLRTTERDGDDAVEDPRQPKHVLLFEWKGGSTFEAKFVKPPTPAEVEDSRKAWLDTNDPDSGLHTHDYKRANPTKVFVPARGRVWKNVDGKAQIWEDAEWVSPPQGPPPKKKQRRMLRVEVGRSEAGDSPAEEYDGSYL